MLKHWQALVAVNEMHVIVIEIIGGADGMNGLESGRAAHGHKERVEAAPVYAEHADIALANRIC
jgi:hypothetical protein